MILKMFPRRYGMDLMTFSCGNFEFEVVCDKYNCVGA